MARPRKPNQLHLASGTFRRDRHGLPGSEPDSIGGLGGPPPDWTGPLEETWAEIATLIPPGVAKHADRFLVEVLARLMHAVRTDPTALTAAVASQIRTCCAELGMSPSARSRMSISAAPKKSKFDGLLGPVTTERSTS
jgi:hypothetical protein